MILVFIFGIVLAASSGVQAKTVKRLCAGQMSMNVGAVEANENGEPIVEQQIVEEQKPNKYELRLAALEEEV